MGKGTEGRVCSCGMDFLHLIRIHHTSYIIMTIYLTPESYCWILVYSSVKWDWWEHWEKSYVEPCRIMPAHGPCSISAATWPSARARLLFLPLISRAEHGWSFCCFGSGEYGVINRTKEKMWGHCSTSKVRSRMKVIKWTIMILKRWERISTKKVFSPQQNFAQTITHYFKRAFTVSAVSRAWRKL